MNYNEAIEYIHSIPKFNRILGNDLLNILLDKMGRPDNKLKFIHIGGTNEKGSISTMTAEILKRAGYKVGLFTSPYLEYFNERIRINGVPISNSDLAGTVEYVKNISERFDAGVSEFAFDTAVAFEYFARNHCDFVVLEVGLGGKLDATNVIKSPVAIGFGAIGLDHCQYLGDTVDEISRDKFGIIKQNSNVVLYPIQEEVVFNNAKEFCTDKNSRLIIPKSGELTDIQYESNSFKYKNQSYSLAMKGEFQIYNAITAIEIIGAVSNQGYNISAEAVTEGLKWAKIDGRLDYINDNLVIDGAHNPQAVKALLGELKKSGRNIHFLTAVMEDKDYGSIVNLIADFAAENSSVVTATEVDMPRCLNCDKLKHEFEKRGIKASAVKPANLALNAVQSEIKNSTDILICVCGSLYLAGEIKRNIT